MAPGARGKEGRAPEGSPERKDQPQPPFPSCGIMTKAALEEMFMGINGTALYGG